MPSIRGSLNNGQPLVSILIAPYDNPTRAQECTALIDTGCTISGISSMMVDALELRHVARKLVVTPLGEARRKAYPFVVGFLSQSDESLGSPRSPYYFPQPILGADFVQNTNFDVLLGMDLLSQGRLIFERGMFEFAF